MMLDITQLLAKDVGYHTTACSGCLVTELLADDVGYNTTLIHLNQ